MILLPKEIETTENVGAAPLELGNHDSNVLLVEANSDRATQEQELQDEVVDAAESQITLKDIKACFEDKVFLKILVIKTLTWIGYHYFMISYKSTGLKYLPQADKNINIIGNLSSLSNALSRVGGGLLYNKLRFSKTQLVILGILASTVILMQPSTWSFVTFGLCVCIFYLSYGLFISSYPLVFDDAFSKQGGLMISLAFGLTFSLGCYLNYLLTPLITVMLGESAAGYAVSLLVMSAWTLIPKVTSSIQQRLRAKSEKILLDRHKKIEMKELQV